MKSSSPISVFDYVAEHGEGPVYDEEANQVFWVDLLKGRVLTGEIDKPNSTTIWQYPEPVGCIGLSDNHKLVLGMQNGFAIAEKEDIRFYTDISSTHEHTNMRFNDGIVGPDGAFYAGTMEMEGKKPVGKLYRLNTDLTFKVIDQDVYIPNGMGWSDDRSTFYMIDTGAHAMYAYDFDAGELSNKRIHIKFPESDFPDGMTMDNDGNFWIAMWEGARVDIYSKQGIKSQSISLPVPYPTSCCFVENQLIISTSQLIATNEQLKHYPLSGHCLIETTEFKGAKQFRFKHGG